MQSRSGRWSGLALFFFLAATGCGLDLWTKAVVFRRLFQPDGEWQQPEWWVDGVLGIQLSFNAGALFGMGHGLSWLFASISFLFLVLILGWVFWIGWSDRWLTVAAGLVTGGILGNLYDRLGFGFLPGYPESARTSVRDWILFRLQGVPMFDPWPNFNLADACLVTGAILILVHSLWMGSPSRPGMNGVSSARAS